MKISKNKKRFLATAIACLMVVPAAAFTLTACDDDNPIQSQIPEKAVTSIKLDTSNAKTKFNWGEEFTAAGLKVIGIMSDGTEEELPLSECTISTPDMRAVGDRSVQVTYKGRRTNYIINVSERVMPRINRTPVFEITGETPQTTYKVEGEAIDMQTPGAEASGGEFIVTAEDEGVSDGKYLANYGTKGNYFGFAFTAEQEYKNVTIVFRAMNPTADALGLGTNMTVYHNYKNWAENGEIDVKDLSTLTPATAGEEGTITCTWEDRLIRGVTLTEGENTLTFEVSGGQVVCIDYIEFYVGTVYEGNRTELSGEGLFVKEFEDFNLEKVINREDIKQAHNLKDGELYIETPADEFVENTSGGKSVASPAKGTEMSTLLCLDDKATVEIFLTAAYPASAGSVYIRDNWEFYIDGVKLRNVESKDIGSGSHLNGEWWNWQDTSLGLVDLEAGNHLFVAKVVGAQSFNCDCFKFDVKSYGSFIERVEGDLIIDEVTEDKAYVLEAEVLDNSEVITRPDFINAGHASGTYVTAKDDNASGGNRIYGFDTGSKFYFKVYATEECTVNISFTGFGANATVAQNISFKLDETELISSEDETSMNVSSLTEFTVAENVTLTKGAHTFVMDVLVKGFDFDCITFTIVSPVA